MDPSDESAAGNAEVERLGRLYSALCQVNQSIVRLTTREALLARVCRVLVETGGFAMAWVGWHDPASDALRPIAEHGDAGDYLRTLRVSVNPTGPEGRGPSGVAFRANRPYICNAVSTDPATMPWRAALARNGFRASAAFPVSQDGRVAGVLSVYAMAEGAFTDREVALLAEAAADLSFGLDSLARADEHRRLYETAQSQKLFADTVIESMPGVVFFFDEQSTLQRWNRNFASLTGYSPEEIGGMRPLDFVAHHDRPRMAAGIADVMRGGETALEVSLLARDGRTIPHFLTGRRVVIEGIGCLAGVGVDITERKRAEQQLAEGERKYRELVQLANSIILRWDSAGRITFLNEFGQRFFGYSEDELLGRSVMDTIVPATESGGRDLTRLMERVLGDPTAFEQNVNENMRRDGSRVWIAWTNRVVRDAQGGIAEVLSVGTDVTERRRLEQQFLRAQRLESIGTLAGGIAHDLNNVLSPILMAVELLRMGEADPGRLDVLETMESSARRGADMIRQVLGFARGVDGVRIEVHVGHLVRDMAKIANETFLKTIAIDLSVQQDLWLVQGDPTQLHQVLMNLCVNARDAMPDGGTLSLSAANATVDEYFAARHLGAAPGAYVVISVSDTGLGIPAHVLDRIFEPFFTTKEPGKGTGLGLPTSMAIVKSHGGFIEVASEPGMGTTFKVFLPAASMEEAIVATPDALVQLPRGSGQLIMVVDDEPAVREVTRQTLEAFGYRVVVAANGIDAIARFTDLKDDVSVVVTDMMMPVMDGPSLIQVLTRLSPTVRIIAVSGLNTAGRTIQAANLGVHHFLSKPYTADMLLRELQQALLEE